MAARAAAVDLAIVKVAQCVDDIDRRAAEGSTRHEALHRGGSYVEPAALVGWLQSNSARLARGIRRPVRGRRGPAAAVR